VTFDVGHTNDRLRVGTSKLVIIIWTDRHARANFFWALSFLAAEAISLSFSLKKAARRDRELASHLRRVLSVFRRTSRTRSALTGTTLASTSKTPRAVAWGYVADESAR
jgi:hypothetical protein